ALVGVVAIDPLEAVRPTIELVERGLGPIRRVEVAAPPLEAGGAGGAEQVPVEARLVIPLAPLAELAAHEEQLLAGQQPLVAEEQAQVRAALPVVAWHIAEQRSLSVHHLVVRQR